MTDCDRRQDAHGSEYVSCADERRSFLTGFSGSSGSALVTADQVPWTGHVNICGLILHSNCSWSPAHEWQWKSQHTVDDGNPAPVDMVNILCGAGFLPSTVPQATLCIAGMKSSEGFFDPSLKMLVAPLGPASRRYCGQTAATLCKLRSSWKELSGC